MATEHWCKEHKQLWFKTQYGYGHPIVDEEGNPLLGDNDKQKWCREPKDESTPQSTSRKMGSSDASIESQVAFKGLIELLVAKVITREEPLGQLTLMWAQSRIAGKTVEQTLGASIQSPSVTQKAEPIKPDPITKDQAKEIRDIVKERELPNSQVSAIIIRKFGVESAKELGRGQAGELILLLKKEKPLDMGEATEPEDLPF